MRRIAFIGLGAAVRNIHLSAVARLSDRVRVVAGADPSEEARAAVAARVPDVFADPREMIERSRPDVIIVCSPPDFHRAHAELALGAGCDVFCEKPLASTLEDADAIIVAAKQSGRTVAVNNEFPAMRIHRAARACIGTTEFGRLLYMHASHTNRPTALTEAGWRGEMPLRLGLEFGIHVLDLARYFFGETPTHVTAHMPRPDSAVPWDAVNIVALDFADGRAASIVLDRLSKGPERYLDVRLDGEHAAVQTSIGGQVRAAVGVHTRTRRPFVDVRFIGGGRAVLEQGDRSRVIASDGQNPFASATMVHFRDFLDALDAGTPPPAAAAHNRESLALVFAAQRSAVERRRVAMTEFPFGAPRAGA
jgi:predicted dehydrogenase